MLDHALEELHHRRLTWMSGTDGRNLVVEAVLAAALVAAMGALLVFAPAGEWAPTWLVASLVAALCVACAVRFEVGPGWNSPMQIIQVPLWFAVPAGWFPVIVAVSLAAGELIERWRSHGPSRGWRPLLAADDTWHAVGAATVLAIVGTPEATVAALPLIGLVFLGQAGADFIFSLVHGRYAHGLSVRGLVPAVGSVVLVDLTLLPIGILAAFAMRSEPGMLLALLPLIGLFSEFARDREQRIVQALELSSAYRGTAQLMSAVLKADDAYTGAEHSEGVVELAMAVGEMLQLDRASTRRLEFGALLHDIGKLQVPNEIINKPGKLDAEEWAIIREHPVWGQEMLDQVGGVLTETGHIVRAHHERWDGTGYPDGLAGTAIPLESRVITVCDSYSAMTTDRAYRAAMTDQAAVAELERCSGTQFDPTVVAAMQQVLTERGSILAVSHAEGVAVGSTRRATLVA